jgi:NAD(P)-dependent dehydrogenase (short-subunit alcohol dehydrogenase family)
MSAGLAGKVAIVTGGAGGLGSAVVRRLGIEGARVVLADVDPDGAQRTAAAARDAGGDVVARPVDIGDPDQVRDLVDGVAADHGRIDVLINVAARLPPAAGAVGELDLDGWNEELRVTLTGTMLASRAAIPHMVAGAGGALVHFASTAGLRGMEPFSSYQVVKAGIIALSRAIAAQYGKQGVRSNVVAPGAILNPARRPAEAMQHVLDSQMTAQLGTPEDIAAVVAFLASDDARLVTAQVIVADGGATMRMPPV